VDELKIRAELRRWVVERAGLEKSRAFDDGTRILEKGILSSLDVVELVLFIESLRGEEVDTEEIDPDVFSSINSLYKAFF
jgi:acyl carrier protein